MSDTQDPTPQSDPDESSADDAAAAPPAPAWRRFLARVPFTVTVVVIMLVLGVVTRSLWEPAPRPRPVRARRRTAFPPSEPAAGGPSSPAPLFALTPAAVPRRHGRLRRARRLVGVAAGHPPGSRSRRSRRRSSASSAPRLLLALVGARRRGWGWAVRVSDDLDVGFSAGAMGAVAAASVTVPPPWRGRVRFILAPLRRPRLPLHRSAVGPRAPDRRARRSGARSRPRRVAVRRLRRPRLTRREWRVTAATLFLVAAIIRLVRLVRPRRRPARCDVGRPTPRSGRCSAGAAVSLLLANGLRKGRRPRWIWSVVLTVAALVLRRRSS